MNVLLSNYNFHEEWIRDELTNHINYTDIVTVLPFSFNSSFIKDIGGWNKAYSKKNGKYYQEIILPFTQYGVKEENIIWVNYYTDSYEDMIQKINNSDVLFLTGGLPEKAVERIHEKKLLDVIKNYNKIIIGSSAGALMQLCDYYVSPDDDYEKFEYFQGLGLIKSDFYIEVHYDESEIQQECINKVLREKGKKIYAIKNNGGIIVENNKVKKFGNVVCY